MPTIRVSRTGANPISVEAIVDQDTLDFIRRKGFGLHVTYKGYIALHIPLHHFVFGKPREGMVIDHINGNRVDNRKGNLREFTPHQNMQHCRQERKKNATGLRGVIPLASGRFGARGCVDGNLLPVKGTFATAREAHAAYLRVVSDRGAMLPTEGADLDFSVLSEFPDTIPGRKRAEQMPVGVTRCGKKFRASVRREGFCQHLSGAFLTVGDAAAAVAEADAAYRTGGLDALKAVANRYKTKQYPSRHPKPRRSDPTPQAPDAPAPGSSL